MHIGNSVSSGSANCESAVSSHAKWYNTGSSRVMLHKLGSLGIFPWYVKQAEVAGKIGRMCASDSSPNANSSTVRVPNLRFSMNDCLLLRSLGQIAQR